jgi:hypothetical protein
VGQKEGGGAALKFALCIFVLQPKIVLTKSERNGKIDKNREKYQQNL